MQSSHLWGRRCCNTISRSMSSSPLNRAFLQCALARLCIGFRREALGSQVGWTTTAYLSRRLTFTSPASKLSPLRTHGTSLTMIRHQYIYYIVLLFHGTILFIYQRNNFYLTDMTGFSFSGSSIKKHLTLSPLQSFESPSS